jgi:hypothetical protein
MRIAIALGGNALLRHSDPMTTEVQRRNIMVEAQAIAAVVLVTFVFTTLHEPASVVTLLAVLVLSIVLDVGWKRSAAAGSGDTTGDVQVGN